MEEAAAAFWGLITALLAALTALVGWVAMMLRPIIAQWMKDKLLKNAIGEAMNRVPGVEMGVPVSPEKASEVVSATVQAATQINPTLAASISDITGDVARRIPVADPEAKT